MKLYLLSTVEIVGYDCFGSHMIVAKSEESARKLAAEIADDEDVDTWLNSQLSTCNRIKVNKLDAEEILISSFNAG